MATKTKKKAIAKKAVAKKPSKVNVAASTAAALAAQNAESTAQPGIISSIMTCLIEAKEKGTPLLAQEILERLVAQFPDRAPEGMMVTIRAQLSRLPTQKKFAISKIRDGKNMRYAAA